MSLSFDGTNDYAEAAADEVVLRTTFPFSFFGWFKFATAPTQNNGEWNLWTLGQNNNTWLHCRIDDGAGAVGTIHTAQRDGGTFRHNMATSNAVTDATDWHSAGLKVTTTAQKVILDGDTGNAGTDTDTNDLFNVGAATTEMNFGRFSGGTISNSDYFDGLLAMFTFWDVELTDAELVQMANGAHPMTVRTGDVIGHFPMWDNGIAPFDISPVSQREDPTTVWTVSGAVAAGEGPPVEMWVPGRRSVFPLFEEAAGGTGTSAMTMLVPTMSATGVATHPGTSAMTIPLPTSTATGKITLSGTSAMTILLPTMSASGTAEHHATSAMTIPLPTASSSGTAEHHATSAMTIPLPTMTATGSASAAGTSAMAMLLPTMAATGTAEHHATSVMTIPLPTASSAGTAEHHATSAMTIPLPTMSSSGTAGVAPSGTSAMTMLLPTMAASGTAEHHATSAMTIPLPTMIAAGSIGHDGTSAMTIPVPTMVGVGTGPTDATGTSAVTLLVPTMIAGGVASRAGTSAMTLPIPTMTGAGSGPAAAHEGTSTMTIPMLTMDATGAALNDARLYGYILDTRNLIYTVIARMRGGF